MREPRRSPVIVAIAVCAIALVVAGWRVGRLVSWKAYAGVRAASIKPATIPVASTVAKVAAAAPEQKRDIAPREIEANAPVTTQPEIVPQVKLERASRTTTTVAEPEPVSTSAAALSDQFVVAVKARKPTWVSISVDGKPLLEGVLKRKKRFPADSEVTLKTNDAGAISVWLNGKHLLPLGADGEETSVSFSRGGVAHSSGSAEPVPLVSGAPAGAAPQASPGSEEMPPEN